MTDVVVVGAGAFGAWTALSLQRAGARVTLVDAWGPGNARASSGGETRAIRCTYGGERIYSRWTARAFELWREAEAQWGVKLLQVTGALWLCGDDDGYVRASLPHLAELGLAIERLEPNDASRRYPQISFDGVAHAYFEEQAGTLFARRACAAVTDAFLREGGAYRCAQVRPERIANAALAGVALSDGSRLEADAFVFACGPWLAKLFPDVLGALAVSRQEVHYFGTPPGPSFTEAALPIWVDLQLGYYGLPASERRGFKLAGDDRGPAFDATAGDRRPTDECVEASRRFLARRFPELANAPLLEHRVCQYTNTPDGHLVVDRHPGAANVWLVGGGSGHGFKLGPALGEVVARWVHDGEPADPQLAIGRLADPSPRRQTLFDTST